MKINILGTEYDLCIGTEKEYPKLKDKDGLCDTSTKKIIVRDMEDQKDDPDSLEDLETYKRKVIRHEIIHAMFYESGLSNEYNDETLVDWIAIQAPKLFTAFNESMSMTFHSQKETVRRICES